MSNMPPGAIGVFGQQSDDRASFDAIAYNSSRRWSVKVLWRVLRLLIALGGVAFVTWAGSAVVPVNSTTVAFAYLLLILVIATVWGYVEAIAASIVATLAFNFFFLPPVGTLTITDPQNVVSLFSFLATALVGSRLSMTAKQRALDSAARQRDVERLYTFSRAILLIEKSESMPKHLIRKLADIFELNAVVLYERRTDEFHRAGPLDFEGLDDQLKDAALQGTTFSDPEQHRIISAVRLGSEPIAALALQGSQMPDSVLQGIGNLVAIGLERARVQDLAAQVEAAQQSEKLRTTLLDAMAHEFKTPLTSVIAATSALLDSPDQPVESRVELLKIADEEAHQLKDLIDDTVEMGRLDATDIRLSAELMNVEELVREVVVSMRADRDNRPIHLASSGVPPMILADHRLLKLAIKQLLDNALKYSSPGLPVTIHIDNVENGIAIAVTDHGKGIPVQEQSRIFDRMYRSPSVERQIPGSGLGLSIALSIVRAHNGDLTVTSRPGETTFRLTLPVPPAGVAR
jgi:two-component system sensor histidine kinase KdpD